VWVCRRLGQDCFSLCFSAYLHILQLLFSVRSMSFREPVHVAVAQPFHHVCVVLPIVLYIKIELSLSAIHLSSFRSRIMHDECVVVKLPQNPSLDVASNGHYSTQRHTTNKQSSPNTGTIDWFSSGPTPPHTRTD
jgi:hypothetical protein